MTIGQSADSSILDRLGSMVGYSWKQICYSLHTENMVLSFHF